MKIKSFNIATLFLSITSFCVLGDENKISQDYTPHLIAEKSTILPLEVTQDHLKKPAQPERSLNEKIKSMPTLLKEENETPQKKEPLSEKSNVSITSAQKPIQENLKQAASSKRILNEETKSVQVAINDLSKKIDSLKTTWFEKSTPALFGFLGIIIGGILNLFLHKSQLNHNLQERQEKSSFEVQQKIFEYRNRQINEFYAPLLVLLTQSKELSEQLCEHLIKSNANRYQFHPEDDLDKEKKSLHIINSSEQRRIFRLIEELPYIGETHPTLLPLVNLIIETGERMAKLIEEKSGLADPRNIQLNSCLGKYLAHLSALKDAYNQAKGYHGSSNVRAHSAAFPRDIQELTRNDYNRICTEIHDWESKATTDRGRK
ncbi:hypothetical protein QK356_18870 [Pseudomonas aeruginosa]|nr:hypothetical protein [Pseudomonas aeruginosa]MBI7468807.1 hypothetical protein [Pseudomonas aeruginosa]MBI8217102.1 hypothetical protein [Pseudomonas aeruginosa]MDI3753779.1 hypothetical protein [Pseudomonas aeruginosa]MDI3997518.1 hypothetical protein [Pseudomonas aeruginosa]